MNKLKLFNELSNCFDNIKFHPKLISDILDIISNSGNEAEFLSKFSTRLKFLNNYKEKAHLQRDKNFEKLKKCSDLYSMHVDCSKHNIRIIYSFLNNGTVLLYGFYERAGKRVTDYSSAIPDSLKRYKEMEELI